MKTPRVGRSPDGVSPPDQGDRPDPNRRRATLPAVGLVLLCALLLLASPLSAQDASAAEPASPLRVEETNGNLAFGGFWIRDSHALMSGGHYAYSAAAGASLTMHFRGTSVAWVGPVGPSYGRAELLVDGRSIGTVSQYAASQTTSASVWSRSGMSDTSHTLTLKVLGSKDASSTGSAVVFDAFDISAEPPASRVVLYRGRLRVEETSRNLAFGGTWARSSGSQMSGGAYAYSYAAGANLTAHFRGTGFDVIGPMGPAYGRAEVLLDGRSLGVLDQYAAQQRATGVVWSRNGLPDTAHTLTLKVLGSKDASSSGSVVVVDALDLLADHPSAGVTLFRHRLRVEDASSNLLFEGSWSKASGQLASGGRYAYSTVSGARVTVHFRGTSVAWVGPLGPSYGQVELMLDGRSIGTLSQYSPVQVSQATLWSRSGLEYRSHTLTLRVQGTKVAQSSGTAVVLDGFDVAANLPATKALELGIPRLSTPWRDYIVIDKSDFRLYYYRDGRFNSLYPVAHGKASTPTPSRVWKIGAKYYTNPTGIYGPRKLRLFPRVNAYGRTRYVYSAYGIHGTNQPWVIGTRASHGCIRLYNRDILALFPLVRYGTMVVTRD